ncbi:ATP-binding protein [Phenylobacterium sp.]|jgi:signal transduction histidine kinase/CheY-like chemotaxis protein|uniref:ATP-binding protein n=1 Tax=Phenylobacterium sp. TaxID=1871053 RepID=UPI002F91CF4F
MPTRASHHNLAVTRAKELWSRVLCGLIIALAAWAVTRTVWPAVWFAAVLAVQMLDHWLAAPIRRDPNHVPTRLREGLYVASFALNTAVYSSISVLCWLQGGLEGHLFAFFIPTGGLLNVALQAQSSPRLLLAGCLPHALYLIALPLLSIVFEASANPLGMGFVVVGGLLYLIHLAVAARRNDRAAAELGGALKVAKLERLRAEQANAAKSEFLTVMSHEIRTPLNGVLGMAQAMAADELPKRQAERLEVVRQSGEVLLTLLNDLLDISKIEAAKLELEARDVDFVDLARHAQAAFAPLAEAKGVTMKVWVADAAKDLRTGDPMRVRQILFNLIGNAVKFTDSGRVTARVTSVGDEVVIEVADTGPGIPPEVLSTLFERFTQADASNARRYGGSGLGLSIARGLARLMGGDITVHSVVGHGSTFTARLRLPSSGETRAAPPAPSATARAAAPAPAPEPAQDGAQDGLRILAAEDNATNRLVLKTLLEQVGLAAHFVENGREAVDAWRAGRWDVILMDIQMPEMDGVTATREIRRLEAELGMARTPVIALTANAMAHQVAEYTAAGMDALSPKPIQLPQLIATLQGVLAAPAEDAGLANGAGEAAA